MVYGLGGASKSILNSIQTSGNIFVANRTEQKIEEFIQTNPILKKYNDESLDLVISCSQNLDLNTIKNFEHLNLSQSSIFYDINYTNQTNTMLEDLAVIQKNQFFNGTGMLVEQAAECFKLWFDKKPAVEDVKNKLNEGI
jgi:shikimate dehydrogenase